MIERPIEVLRFEPKIPFDKNLNRREFNLWYAVRYMRADQLEAKVNLKPRFRSQRHGDAGAGAGLRPVTAGRGRRRRDYRESECVGGSDPPTGSGAGPGLGRPAVRRLGAPGAERPTERRRPRPYRARHRPDAGATPAADRRTTAGRSPPRATPRAAAALRGLAPPPRQRH